jgi:uncharacterized membrane protein
MRVQQAPGWLDPGASARVWASFVLGACVAAGLAATGEGRLAGLVGWDSAAIFYLVWMWWSIWGLDAEETTARSRRDDPSKVMADGILVSAAVASLAAVGVLLIQAAHQKGASQDLYAGLGIVSVVIAWGVVHTVFCLRYASLYYAGEPGGIDFNQTAPPRYSDFAYVAFTIGTTFQVSDTDIEDHATRTTVLRQCLLAYLFGAVIIAATINLVAGLGTNG